MSSATKTSDRILAAMLGLDPSSTNAIAGVVGFTPDTVREHLRALRYAGYVDHDRRPYSVYWLSDLGRLKVRAEDLSAVPQRRVYGEPGALVKRPTIPTTARQWWQV